MPKTLNSPISSHASSRMVRNILVACTALASFSLASMEGTDGKTWQQLDTGTTQTLYQISAANSDFVVASGSNKTLLLFQDGAWKPFSGWEAYSASNTPFGSWTGDYLRLYATALSNTEVWIGSYGSQGNLLKWNDGTFSEVRTGTSQRTLRMNNANGHILAARGNAWTTVILPSGNNNTRQAFPNTTFLTAEVAGFDRDHLFAIGNNRIAHSTNGGHAWTELATPNYIDAETSIRAVAVYDAETAWFGTSTGLLFSWNKTNETFAQSPEAELGFSINGIYAKSAEEIWIIGNEGHLWFFNGTEASRIDLGTTANLLSITGADGEVWVAGSNGVVYSTIPEPKTSALLLMISCGLWRGLYRKRTKANALPCAIAGKAKL